MKTCKYIGISGASRSGKSELAEQIQAQLESVGKKSLVIGQDDYCIPKEQLPRIKDRYDWEQPESIDWDRLHAVIDEAKPKYDVVIIEGIFVLDDQKLLECYTTLVELEISHETYWERRKRETRWGLEPDWYIQYVWDYYHQRTKVPTRALRFSGEEPVEFSSLIARFISEYY